MKYIVKPNIVEVFAEKRLEAKWIRQIVGKVFVSDDAMKTQLIKQAAFPPFAEYLAGTIDGFEGGFQLPLEVLEEYEQQYK